MADIANSPPGRVRVQVRHNGFPPAADPFDNISQARAGALHIEAKLDDGINVTIARRLQAARSDAWCDG